jgi:hypothetical protein
MLQRSKSDDRRLTSRLLTKLERLLQFPLTMRKMLMAVAVTFFASGSALAQEPTGGLGREAALLIPLDWMPDTARLTIQRQAAGRPISVMRMQIGNQEIYEADYGDERVRVSEDGTIVGRDHKIRR